ncbi:hypothetical protein T4D_6542 [Trichinella pseudospiralis]|uniref:Uncharacterized protein n=1 Tax=Trichinella pseudospiralis TaxID=6337 RepID=A0A0V1F892_TRIPS|nr:hypothetical protein T4D_6542 [Trichinella pseudospiralis]
MNQFLSTGVPSPHFRGIDLPLFGAAFTQIHKIQPAFIDALLFLTKSGHCPFPQFLTGCLRCGMSLEHFDKIFVFFD